MAAETDTHRYRVIENWGRGPGGRAPGGIVPGVAVDSHGRVYTPIREPSVVLAYDREGSFLRSWGKDLFVNPHGIYVDVDDHIWVTDVGDHTVRKFDSKGELLLTLGTPGEPGELDSPFNMPTKAVTTVAGDILVSDGYGQCRIHRFSPDGQLLMSWGSKGTGPGQFGLPHGLWVDRQGRILVADREPVARIQVFDDDGTYITEWTDVWGPNDLCADQEDNIYVAEAARRVSVFSPEGELLARWGEHVSSPGQFPDYPHGIWVDDRNDLYVTEVPFIDNRLQKFERVSGRSG